MSLFNFIGNCCYVAWQKQSAGFAFLFRHRLRLTTLPWEREKGEKYGKID